MNAVKVMLDEIFGINTWSALPISGGALVLLQSGILLLLVSSNRIVSRSATMGDAGRGQFHCGCHADPIHSD